MTAPVASDEAVSRESSARGGVGDLFGGLASMLVALPSAIAFGLVVYAPLGAEHVAKGALAGILGAVAIGLVAPTFGGTPRLISAPCAPAAAVLAALATELVGPAGLMPESIPLLLTLVALGAGLLQFLFGAVGGGRLIKYIPYPVVAGYLSGVGVLIFIGQLPKLLGTPKGIGFWAGIEAPALWNLPALGVGGVTIAAMLLAPRVTRAVPAPILALSAGIAAYFAAGLAAPEMLRLEGNPMIIGPIQGGGSFLGALTERLASVGSLGAGTLRLLLAPALMLAVLLSIDTLKTCVVIDALTRSRHDSNRELIGQGLGNLASSVVGGMPGAGTMGATLVNLSGGGRTRMSGVLMGVFSLLALLLFGRLVAWVPISALAGILIVVAFRMIDKNSLGLLRRRSTLFDFLVVAAVILTAVATNLMAAAGVGVGLAILLFLREQIRGTVVRRRMLGNQVFSKKRRLPAEVEVLEANGGQTVVLDLQGSLFFGTADQLYTELEPHLKTARHVILHMRRVGTVDFTAAHTLELLEAQLAEHGGVLIFADLPPSLPTGQDLQSYFAHVGLMKPMKHIRIFPTLDEALEWAEERILAGTSVQTGDEAMLELGEIGVLAGLPDSVFAALAPCVGRRSCAAGEKIFAKGDTGDEVFLIRCGTVRIVLPLLGGKGHHLASFGRGDFFGDMAFLDRGIRSADAIATTAAELFVISRAEFDRVAHEHPELAGMFFSRLARALAARLRLTDGELQVLQES